MNNNAEMIARWTETGDKAMKRQEYGLAISMYVNAFSVERAEKAKYLIPRISACYRRMRNPRAAIRFYENAIKAHGDIVIDNVVLTAVSSAYGDIEEWETALKCADRAAYLNDGVVDEYLENVYARIHSNMRRVQ